jgi:hypothetical protein
MISNRSYKRYDIQKAGFMPQCIMTCAGKSRVGNGCQTKQTSALIPAAHQEGDANSFSNLKFTKLKLCPVFKLGFSG